MSWERPAVDKSLPDSATRGTDVWVSDDHETGDGWEVSDPWTVAASKKPRIGNTTRDDFNRQFGNKPRGNRLTAD